MHGRERRVVGIAAGLTLLLAGCSTAPSATPGSTPGPTSSLAATASPALPATEQPSATTNPTAAPTSPATAGEWRAVLNDAVAGAQFLEVAWTGSQFIATGTALAGGGVFARSSDGKTWKSATAGGTTGSPYHIAAGPAGVVATGTLDDKTASWFSTDGIHWNYHLKIFPKSIGTDDVVGVNDVIATPDGWLAVGADNPPCFVSCVPNPIRGLVWTSTNGLDWTRLANQASLKGGGINAVVAIDGGYVAAGAAGGRAAFWSSPDGKAWTRVADDKSFGITGTGAGVQVVGLAVRDGIIVAVGMEQTGGGDSAPLLRAWHSIDGQAWSKSTVDLGLGGQVFGVAATPTGFLATGPSGAPSCLGGIWSSTTGASWACEASDPGFEGFGPYAVAGSPTVEVAVGLTNAGCGEDGCPQGLPGAIWWRPIR